MLKDFSVSALVAGFITVLVGFTSTGVIVYQAATTLGATPAQAGSWLFAICLGTGVTTIALSLRHRIPVVTAWCTPGAAMLITSASGYSMPEAVGAFLISGLLIAACGFTRIFERALAHIPLSLASAMLAGILLRFGIDAFLALKTAFALAFGMICAYLVARRMIPRYAVLAALVAGLGAAGAKGILNFESVGFAVTTPVFTVPHFTPGAFFGLALPLFAVTMCSQNVPGVAALRAHGYAPPISSAVGWTGAANAMLAPLGAFALNLAAITAAICMGKEAHEDPARRYVAALSAGLFYILLGVFGGTVTSLFAAFPRELVLCVAGLALMSTIGNGLVVALSSERDREPALVTFLVTASGVTLLGVGSAFWGLVGGALASGVLKFGKAKT